uniref:Uncharacterized protein n=1 Tax=Sinocyclocheilus rhinocerous TaxID=307959 RepID=A0A673I7F0_9TELE
KKKTLLSFPASPSCCLTRFLGGASGSASEPEPSLRTPDSSWIPASPALPGPASRAPPTGPTPRPDDEEPGAAATPNSIRSSIEDIRLSLRGYLG